MKEKRGVGQDGVEGRGRTERGRQRDEEEKGQKKFTKLILFYVYDEHFLSFLPVLLWDCMFKLNDMKLPTSDWF